MRSTNVSSESQLIFAAAGSSRRVIVSAVPFGLLKHCLNPRGLIHEKKARWLGAALRPSATGTRGARGDVHPAKAAARSRLRPRSRRAPAGPGSSGKETAVTLGRFKSRLCGPAPFGLGPLIAALARSCGLDVRLTAARWGRTAINGCGAHRSHPRPCPARLRLVAQGEARPARMATCQTDRGFFDGARFSWASAWSHGAQRREIGFSFLVENG